MVNAAAIPSARVRLSGYLLTKAPQGVFKKQIGPGSDEAPGNNNGIRFVAFREKVQDFGVIVHRIETKKREPCLAMQYRIGLYFFTHRLEGIPSQGATLGVRA